ncbi:Acid protease [Mycena indigotica]|uniref:Acid protease n=1 Tax=Mycena indigotica TaxID=2126181 RepID=A0A8H6T5D3_9AGAR|nr:Acid protease [Mycena indigotica]KAF7310257.1 Acid protease [Mycena indigotica]
MGSCFSFISSRFTTSDKAATDKHVPKTPATDAANNMSVLRPLVRNARTKNFFSAYARAANRYGFQSTQFAPFKKHENKVVHIKASGESGDVPAASVENVQSAAEYVVPVKIGTPGITLNLDFDTGSSDLWVWSSELTRVSKTGHNIYNPSKSKTATEQKGSKWNISYGDGSSASGNVYLDTVTIGGVAIPKQAVELAQKLSAQFAQGEGSDGLLGLAWPAINTVAPKPVKTPVQNMIDQGLITQPLFTVKLDRGDNAGFYSFGEIDETVTSNPITYTDVDSSQGFWMVPSTSFTLNGKTIQREGNTAILDTGTTLALVDDDTVSAIYGKIKGAKFDQNQGGWMYPSTSTVPDIQFAIGDTLYTLNAADFPFGDADDGFVFGGVQSRGSNPFDILGDIFLKSVYVVFNQGESTVGLAQRDD